MSILVQSVRSKVILKTCCSTRWVLRAPLRDAFGSQRVPHRREAHRGVLDGEKVSKFIDEPSRLRVGNPKAPLKYILLFIYDKHIL